MNLVFLVVAIVLLTKVPFGQSMPSYPAALPRVPFELEDLSLNERSSTVATVRLRKALTDLLALNDGELNALLMGVPLESVAESMSPVTEFLIKASGQHLQQLQTLLSTDEGKQLLAEDLKIARRRKKLTDGALTTEEGVEEIEKFEALEETDSLLAALADLSTYLRQDDPTQGRTRRSHRKAKNHFHSRKTQKTQKTQKTTHYSYWLRANQCPEMEEGTRQLFCPSPELDNTWTCIDSSSLCDGHTHCPNGEDEDPEACLFYKSIQNQIDIIVDNMIQSRRRSS